MALWNTKRVFAAKTSDISALMAFIKAHFEKKGYSVETQETAAGGFVSLTKGGLFSSVLGMKTGLNVALTRLPEGVEAAMAVGIFGKQALPTAITVFVFWPVVIGQLIGVIQQYSLDEEAYGVIEEGLKACETDSAAPDTGSAEADDIETDDSAFCPFCGSAAPAGSGFCPFCGKRQER